MWGHRDEVITEGPTTSCDPHSFLFLKRNQTGSSSSEKRPHRSTTKQLCHVLVCDLVISCFILKFYCLFPPFFVICRLFSPLTCVWLVNSLLFKRRLFLPCLPAAPRYRSVFCSAFVSGIFGLLVFFIWVVTVLPQANYDPYLCLLLAGNSSKTGSQVTSNSRVFRM